MRGAPEIAFGLTPIPSSSYIAVIWGPQRRGRGQRPQLVMAYRKGMQLDLAAVLFSMGVVYLVYGPNPNPPTGSYDEAKESAAWRRGPRPGLVRRSPWGGRCRRRPGSSLRAGDDAERCGLAGVEDAGRAHELL